MTKDFICIYCGQPTAKHHGCRVCHSCKTLSNFNLDAEDLWAETQKCINSIQEYIESMHDTLYNIESRHINKKKLTENEQQMYEFCSCFQSCRNELEFMINNHFSLQDKRFRSNLYTLLHLSIDFPHVFGHECHTLTV